MVYKKLLLFVLFCIIANKQLKAQNIIGYFLLDSIQQKGLRYNHIKCSDETYKAELFNVFYPGDSTRLTLFTALPDYKSGKPEWKEINLDSIRSKLISLDSLSRQSNKAYRNYVNTKGKWVAGAELKSEYRKPIIKIGEKYFTPSSASTMEHFYILKITDPGKYISNIFPNLNQFFEINLDAPIFSLTDFEKIYLEKFKHLSFNSLYDVSHRDRYVDHYMYDKPILIRDKSIQIDGKTAYKFWTIASWMIDGRGEERGIDRFAYIPEIGIVSGAYSYYFWDKDRGNDNPKLVRNYVEDVQLMPYEINGKPINKN